MVFLNLSNYSSINGRVWNTQRILKEKNAKVENIIELLLMARGIENKNDIKLFFDPPDPHSIPLKDIGIKETEIKKLTDRLKKAKKENEQIVIFGDYDTDGVCATAIVWEVLYKMGFKVMPYLPNRFEEGYGIKADSIKKLKKIYPDLGLIITVDNGIVAFEAASEAQKLGIDLVISDHHEPGSVKPQSLAVIHTTKTSGAGVSWFLARETVKFFKSDLDLKDLLGLCALGTVADQLPLLGINRALVKHGITALRTTDRPGIIELCNVAQVVQENIGTYEINYALAPRINAMGRLDHAMDSLRLLCTKNHTQAKNYANKVGKTNSERQKIVEEVVFHADQSASQKNWENIIVLSHESYHEGVIGLAAAKLVEKYHLPAIVMTENEGICKASARSIPGFNIIKAIRQLEGYLITGGGHEMAAGFSINKENLDSFINEIDKIAASLLTDEIRTRKLQIDLELDFNALSWDLAEKLIAFEPCGVGNFNPVFRTNNVEIKENKLLGKDGKHLRLILKESEREYEAVAFGLGNQAKALNVGRKIDIAYNLDINRWNGRESLQLKIKDIMI